MSTRILKLDEKQSVQYAVPLWLRDEQIKLAVQRVKGRIHRSEEKRTEPIAIVGFGPSLRETWEKVREFTWIMTCSGSHKFLLERQIIPSWHVEVDPRSHKVQLLGTPHSGVIYLPASTCHPEYFDHLEKYSAKVQLWHVFDNDQEALRVLPHGEWAITGGCDVGLRCLTIARFFGFTEQHIFGIDGSAPPEQEGRHAADHPKGYKLDASVECNGRTFHTSAAMLEAARQIFHELNMMPDVQPTFYGDGLVQHMAKTYVPNPVKNPMIAFAKPELISAEYRDLNKQLHAENLAYGVGGEKHRDTIVNLCKTLKTKDVLDYGCGKSRLARSLPFHIQEYDPAMPGKEQSPKPADIVVCTDVLEHVEENKLLFVLDDLRRCVLQVGYLTIHTGPAKKTLPDGRNTHLIQQGKEWWARRLSDFFEVGKIIQRGPELHCIVGPRMRKQKRVPMSVVPEPQLVEA